MTSEPEHEAEAKEGTLSRRDFAWRIAAIAAAAAVPSSLMGEPEQKPRAGASKRAGAAQARPGGRPPLSAAEQAEVDAKYEAVMGRYGTRLSAEQKKQVRQSLEFDQRRLEPMRAYPLENGDEPATMFGSLPPAEGGES
jgi:hypothetical protein